MVTETEKQKSRAILKKKVGVWDVTDFHEIGWIKVNNICANISLSTFRHKLQQFDLKLNDTAKSVDLKHLMLSLQMVPTKNAKRIKTL